jgi:hypothetical protein
MLTHWRELHRKYLFLIGRLENDLAFYTKEASQIEKQSTGLKMVENAQGKAFKEMNAGNAVLKRYSSMKNKNSVMKEKYKEKLEYLQQKEKLQDNDHKEIIEMEEK